MVTAATPPDASDRPRRVNVLGVGVHEITLQRAVDILLDAAATSRRGYVCVTGMTAILEAQQDPGFREIVNRSLLTTPDGMPAVWFGRLTGHRGIDRVYGPDLMLALCEASVAPGYSHFFYGGVAGVAETLATSLSSRFPGLRIAGTYTPPFRPLLPDEEEDLRRRMAQSPPDFVWVGISTPKQERFMATYLPRLPGTVYLGVGAAFDMHSGRTLQAPKWMQRSGLEWFFRLVTEPRRLWRRYLMGVPVYAFRLVQQLLGLRRYSIAPPEPTSPGDALSASPRAVPPPPPFPR